MNYLLYFPKDIKNIIGEYAGNPTRWYKKQMDNIIQILESSIIVIKQNGSCIFTDKLISILATEIEYNLGKSIQTRIILYNFNAYKIDNLHKYINYPKYKKLFKKYHKK